MTTLPDWLLDGYVASRMPEFINFAWHAQKMTFTSEQTAKLRGTRYLEHAWLFKGHVLQMLGSEHQDNPASHGWGIAHAFGLVGMMAMQQVLDGAAPSEIQLNELLESVPESIDHFFRYCNSLVGPAVALKDMIPAWISLQAGAESLMAHLNADTRSHFAIQIQHLFDTVIARTYTDYYDPFEDPFQAFVDYGETPKIPDGTEITDDAGEKATVWTLDGQVLTLAGSRYEVSDYTDLPINPAQHGCMLMPLGDPEADLPLQFVLDDVDGPSVMRLTFVLAEESPESDLWKRSVEQWWQILERLTEREVLLQEMGEMRGLNVVANAPLLKLSVIWSAELPLTAQLRKERACQLLAAITQANLLAQVRAWDDATASPEGIDSSSQQDTGQFQGDHSALTPPEIYAVSHTDGELPITILSSHAGRDIQPHDPPWPVYLMMDGGEGFAEIFFEYLLPILPGEDLATGASICRAAIVEVLPPAWRNPVEVNLERQTAPTHLGVTCIYYPDPGVTLPSAEERAALLAEVATRSAELGLLSTLSRAVLKSGQLLAQLEDEDLEAESLDDADSEDDAFPEELQTLRGPAPESLIRTIYNVFQHNAPGVDWRTTMLLKSQLGHLSQWVPLALELEPLSTHMMLTLSLRLDELCAPAVRLRLDSMLSSDPIRSLFAAFGSEHLAELGLSGTASINIELEEVLLKIRFFDPDPVAQEDTEGKLFAVALACQNHLLPRFKAVLQGLIDNADDAGQEEGTFDGDVVLGPDFLQRAGVQRQGDQTDSFLPVVWYEGDAQRVQSLLWLGADEQRPYPVLVVSTTVSLYEQHSSNIAVAACQEHFMRLSVPPEVLPQVGQSWIAGRTLTPALLIEPVQAGNVPVVMIQTWPVFGPMTSTLLRYLLSTSFGQFQDMLQRAGVPLKPEFIPPPSTGRGDRSWLSTENLLKLVGNELTWEESRQNEVHCQINMTLKNERAQPRKFLQFRKATDSIQLGVTFYLRFVDEEEGSYPSLALRAHTQGGVAKGRLEQVVAHHLEHLHLQMGKLLPVNVDRDGDMTIRQIVLCPEEPDPAQVRHLIQTAMQSLIFAAHELLF